jgi:predicted anti-sigma-YlaC factor YlaD
MLEVHSQDGKISPHQRGRFIRIVLLMVLCGSVLAACSIEQFAVQKLSDILSGAGGDSLVFTGEEDPELLGDALPFVLKVYEILLEKDPENPELLLTTGQAFILYGYAFVLTPAEMMPDDSYEESLLMKDRAKKLFLRSRRYLLQALELRHPGFQQAMEGENWQQAVAETGEEDMPYLYWAGSAWLAAFSADAFDMELMVTLPRAVGLLDRVKEQDEDYDNGGLHELYISVYGSLPESLGGSAEKARYHLDRAVELTEGKKAGPFVSFATSVTVPKQDYPEFKDLLERALAVDLDAEPKYRLQNILSQRKARWLLQHADDYFLVMEEE